MPEPVAPTVRNDKRRAKRRPLCLAATLVAEPSHILACTVHDVSETGARIETGRPDAVPDRFTLLLTPNGFPRRDCRVVWRRDGFLGVTFVPRAAMAAEPA